jgi:hypothetical protein
MPTPSDVSGGSATADNDEAVPATSVDRAGWLWSPPEGKLPTPPVQTRHTELPVGKLAWENAERLFLRLLERVGEFQWAKLYGTRGQDQEGIDAYARVRAASPGTSEGRPYVVLQSRKVQQLTASGIDGAIADFLEGSWPSATSKYIFATSFDLTDTRLDAALRRAGDTLAEHGIEFVPWGAVAVSDMLKTRPELVDDFFGRAWVEPFCGPDGLKRVSNRLEWVDAQALRERLSAHYLAVFAAQNAVSRPTSTNGEQGGEGAGLPASFLNDFIVVDVTPRSGPVNGDQDAATARTGDRPHADAMKAFAEPADLPWPEAIGGAAETLGDVRSRTGLGLPRRSFRAVEDLLGENRTSSGDSSFRQDADDWLAGGRRTLLVGAPGSGKSSLLRFVAVDLLNPNPQSSVLQQAHGGRLPVWLPFGFLSRHLADADGNSLESAIQAWLQARGMSETWPLVERALSDDRLLLLVDGIDEWKSPAAANNALGAVESFLGQRPEAAAVLSSRPYGVERLTFTLPWSRADVADLDDEQQYAMSAQYLAPPAAFERNSEVVESSATDAAVVWDRAHVRPFLDELGGVPELAVLARKPLFLALLATSWRGEPLPPKRFALYDEIVDLMVRRHPAMRRRFSIVVDLPLEEREFKILMEAVAFLLVSDGRTDAVPVIEMQQLVMQALCDDDVLGYPAAESHSMAKAAMRMAEDEFGLLVPQGADHVGFVHRVLLDHLAGRRLARLAPAEQVAVFDGRLADPAWLDVLLASLTVQSNPHTVSELLDHVSGPATDSGVPGDGGARNWPHQAFHADSATELVAHALAAEVALPPRKVAEYLARLVDQVETSPTVEHRVNVVAALVKACANPVMRRSLLPTFKRWLDATRPYPAPAVYALRDLDVPDESAAAILLHAMTVESGDVRANAAEAYARRFGAPRPDPDAAADASPEAGQSRKDAGSVSDLERLEPLVRLVREGPTVKAQATAILTMGTGWPDEEVTREHLNWGRRQSRATLRITSMYMLMKSEPDAKLSSMLSRDEINWVLAHIDGERWLSEHAWTEMTTELVVRLVAEAHEGYRTELAGFVLETLMTNGSSGGNRGLSWRLACGPLADDDRLRGWVRGELSSSDEHALILYNLTLVPAQWRDDPSFAQAYADYAEKQVGGISGSAPTIAQNLPTAQAKAVLLKGLSGMRPQAVAWRLVQDFANEEDVQVALRECLTDDDKAGNFASVSVPVLGTEAGFERILNLLSKALEPDSSVDGQQQVLLAEAVATAWRQMRDAVAADDAGQVPEEELRGTHDSSAEERLVQAHRVVIGHVEADVCALCTAVDTYFGWQIADVIYTWPHLTAEYAIAALRNNRHVTEGLADTIHSAALRVHVEQPGPESRRVVDLALELMLFLDPEIREVLAHELCRSSVPGEDLLDVFNAWKNDPDDGVRQTVAVGLTQVLIREQAGRNTATPQMETWRASVRQDLCSYGPNMDSNRRNAWLSMLLLNDLALIDGLTETIGDPDEPGVDLSDIYGWPDSLLVTLIADRWEDLGTHFGEALIRRLSASRFKPAEQDKRALRAVRSLAASAGRNSAVSGLVEAHLASETVDGSGSLRLSIPVMQEQKRRLGADRSSLELVVLAADESHNSHDPFDRVVRWAVAEMLNLGSWKVDVEEVREVLATGAVGSPVRARGRKVRAANADVQGDSGEVEEPGVWDWDRAWLDDQFVCRRSVWALLFPQDARTQGWLAGLGSWFVEGAESSGSPASWLEACALSFGASPAEHLPAIVERLFDPMRLEMLDDTLWELTLPLLHRLRHDQEAVASLRASLGAETVNEDSPLFAADSTSDALLRHGIGQVSDAELLERSAQRAFVSALALQRSGHLEPADLDACLETLRKVDPRTVVVDPFLNKAGPVWSAGVTLLRAG